MAFVTAGAIGGVPGSPAPPMRSPLFYLDEVALPLATRALLQVTLDYLK